jgi:phospholipase/carboxylesterase
MLASKERLIKSLSKYLFISDFALLAPQAANGSWYPLPFLAPPEQNGPWLSSAIGFLKEIVDDLNKTGIGSENIFFLGFSQGACLVAESVARNAKHFGGTAVFTGGIIGDQAY